jgi:hypothetical protein
MHEPDPSEIKQIAIPILIAEAAVLAGLYIAVVLGVFRGLFS